MCPTSRSARVQASVPAGLDAASSAGSTMSLAGGEMRRLTIPTRCTRWGSFAIGAVTIRAYDRLGLFRYDARREAQIALKVYPSSERLRTLVRPARTLRLVGSLISREHEEGIELAEVRPFRPGDRVRSVNWRASARRGDLWVDRHPERNADVVIFVDAYTDLVASDASSLEIAVRAAASIADAHLAVRDRVGLVTFGGALRWLVPGDGRRQLYRIVDALLDTQISVSYAWRDIDVLPVRTLPPRALVLALSPLLDERSIGRSSSWPAGASTSRCWSSRPSASSRARGPRRSDSPAGSGGWNETCSGIVSSVSASRSAHGARTFRSARCSTASKHSGGTPSRLGHESVVRRRGRRHRAHGGDGVQRQR